MSEESKLEMDVKSARRDGTITSQSEVKIQSENAATREQLVDLAVKLNEKITERHAAYFVARDLGYSLPYTTRRFELKG